MDQPTQKKPYVAPSLEVREQLAEVTEGMVVVATTAGRFEA
jgi:hypothetical protein